MSDVHREEGWECLQKLLEAAHQRSLDDEKRINENLDTTARILKDIKDAEPSMAERLLDHAAIVIVLGVLITLGLIAVVSASYGLYVLFTPPNKLELGIATILGAVVAVWAIRRVLKMMFYL